MWASFWFVCWNDEENIDRRNHTDRWRVIHCPHNNEPVRVSRRHPTSTAWGALYTLKRLCVFAMFEAKGMKLTTPRATCSHNHIPNMLPLTLFLYPKSMQAENLAMFDLYPAEHGASAHYDI